MSYAVNCRQNQQVGVILFGIVTSARQHMEEAHTVECILNAGIEHMEKCNLDYGEVYL